MISFILFIYILLSYIYISMHTSHLIQQIFTSFSSIFSLQLSQYKVSFLHPSIKKGIQHAKPINKNIEHKIVTFVD